MEEGNNTNTLDSHPEAVSRRSSPRGAARATGRFGSVRPAVEDFVDAIERLSVSEPEPATPPPRPRSVSPPNSRPTTPPPPPRIFPDFAVSTPGPKGKYYVVSVGRQTGVFTNWNYVDKLVTGVPKNAHQSYKSKVAAWDAYEALKEAGLLKVVRTSRWDDLLYGPAESAMM
ncbi:hypothetical protein LshimejAT787_0703910 [Lyophyllum shimeji]|uniref:Ribonuclease H1 N-terminal domain-containing protein n=1 Tax=Lyophyllum shimeji TaxID=47721 RepID=A0A9P3UR49_LYOSH|nr:hypothetical protein LshimejAT787_0703910 [Lyophyllum shimeji]